MTLANIFLRKIMKTIHLLLNDEINIKADILDANEIKKALSQIAKYELQNFISSNNLQKTERLNSFLTTHVNQVVKNSSNIKMNLKVDLQIDNPANLDKDIESNLTTIKKVYSLLNF